MYGCLNWYQLNIQLISSAKSSENSTINYVVEKEWKKAEEMN